MIVQDSKPYPRLYAHQHSSLVYVVLVPDDHPICLGSTYGNGNPFWSSNYCDERGLSKYYVPPESLTQYRREAAERLFVEQQPAVARLLRAVSRERLNA